MRAVATNSAPDGAQNTQRHANEVISIGTGPSNSPGMVSKNAFALRNAQIVAGKLKAKRHSSAATASRGLFRPSRQTLAIPLPAPVQNSHVASRIPSAISLPLKTWISSRMSTICPTTALNPQSASATREPRAHAPATFAGDSGFSGFTGRKLEAGGAENARTANIATPRKEKASGPAAAEHRHIIFNDLQR